MSKFNSFLVIFLSAIVALFCDAKFVGLCKITFDADADSRYTGSHLEIPNTYFLGSCLNYETYSRTLQI